MRNIGAFFDLDGTLLAAPSLERRFQRYLAWRGEIGPGRQARWLSRFLRRVWSDPFAAVYANKLYLAGARASTVEAWVEWLRRSPLVFFPEAVTRLGWHAAQGHRVFFLSGTLAPLARATVQELNRLGMPRAAEIIVCATDLELEGDCWTGEIAGELVCGAAKTRALDRWAAEHHLDLAASYAYGDTMSDRGMLERVGHPSAVNPSRRLMRLARRRGWPVLRWSHPRRREMQAGLAREPESGAMPKSGRRDDSAIGCTTQLEDNR